MAKNQTNIIKVVSSAGLTVYLPPRFLDKLIYSSVRQTDSALSNLFLNIHGHIEVPKSIFFFKSCPPAVISLYMSRFS